VNSLKERRDVRGEKSKMVGKEVVFYASSSVVLALSFEILIFLPESYM